MNAPKTTATPVPATLDHDSCYRALLARDPRFDGAFFVGVSTTGIYCRTVCPARTPRPDRCTFYPTAAAAERAGFRPCLRCRPERAPGRTTAAVDAVARLAAGAFHRIEDGALADGGTLEELAEEMGVSSRHLRRATLAVYGVTPVELAQTRRLLHARRLLAETDLPVSEIAFASGFGSLRRFNALFQERYRQAPASLRRRRAVAVSQEDAPSPVLVTEAAYRPPLDWPALLRFLSDRALHGVEQVETENDGAYTRTVALAGRTGWVRVSPGREGKNVLRVEMASELAPVLPTVLARVRQRFDLAADPQAIADALGPLASERPGLRVAGAWDGWETAVRAILGQQISVRAATTLARRFTLAFGQPVATPFPDLTHLPPTPERIAAATEDEIAGLGIVGARARSILALARAVAERRIVLEPGGDVPRTLARLQELPGIGPWTAQYIALRALAWPDAFPASDLGLLKALGETDPKRVAARAEVWRPWRAYAAVHLWESLPTPLEKEAPL